MANDGELGTNTKKNNGDLNSIELLISAFDTHTHIVQVVLNFIALLTYRFPHLLPLPLPRIWSLWEASAKGNRRSRRPTSLMPSSSNASPLGNVFFCDHLVYGRLLPCCARGPIFGLFPFHSFAPDTCPFTLLSNVRQ